MALGGGAAAQPLVGIRSLALSPDGQQIAFTYRGDIWVAPSQGGRANPVTNHVEMDDLPVWSPDGTRIAFASNRFGNSDIFVVPAAGGRVTRVTWHDDNEAPADWTPDGRGILFRAVRDGHQNGLFTIDVESLALRRLTLDMFSMGRSSLSIGAQAQFSPDGRSVLFPRQGFIWSRPRYQGSAAQQLWLLDPATGRRTQLRNNGFQHLWPRFLPDGRIVTITVSELTPSSRRVGQEAAPLVDSAVRTPNVVEIGRNGQARRLTNFVGSPVRHLSVAKQIGLIAFERDGKVFLMRAGESPREVSFTAAVDDKTTNEERLVLTGEAVQSALDPKGERMAFVARNDIWIVPVKKGRGPNKDDAQRLTDWAGYDRNPVWSPDGKTLFFTSDRDGVERLYALEVESRQVRPISTAGHDVALPEITPDRKSISFWRTGRGGGLFLAPLAGGEPRRIVDLPRQFRWSADPGYAFSPDMRWVAYSVESARGIVNLFIQEVAGSTPVNVTRLNADHGSPWFSPDGKYLYFRSNRGGAGLYILPLQREDAPAEELELKYEKPKETATVAIDFDRIWLRARRLISQVPSGNIRASAETGDLLFLSEGDIWTVKYNGEDLRRVTSGGGIGEFELSEDGKQVVFTRSGQPQTQEWANRQAQPQPVAFRAEWTRDVRAERRAAFFEFWREYNRSFYDPAFHGRDWVEIRTRYEPLLEGVGHRNEMAFVLNMMVGELEASHTEAGPAAGNPSGTPVAGLGFTYDYGHTGPGIRVADVPEGAPGSFARTRIASGEYVMAINGRDVSLNETIYRDILVGQVGRELTLLVNKTPSKSGAREVKFRGLSGGQWYQIEYDNRTERRRKRVDQRSGGRIAYLHIAGMGGGNFDRFMQEAWELIQDKKAVIIDVRENGGGNISDRLIDMLERVPHSIYQDRDAEPSPAPAQSWALPTVVLHAESSLSNAEMFPSAMKQRRLATLIGMPTPGYVIWTYGFSLVDGSSARMPTAGVYRLDGSPMENLGQQPDIRVEVTNEQFFAGEDPQLDRAIDELLRQLR